MKTMTVVSLLVAGAVFGFALATMRAARLREFRRKLFAACVKEPLLG